MEKTKVCTKCGKELPATTEYYHKHKTGKLGLRADCKNCAKMHRKENKEQIRKRRKQYCKENKEQISEQQKQYYEENKQRISERKKQYYEENKEQILEKKKQYIKENKEQIKQYYKENKEQISERQKQHYVENKEQILGRHKQYCKENKEQIKQYREKNKVRIKKYNTQYMKEKRNKDIGFRILSNCRTRLYQVIKGNLKSASTKKLIGCSVEKLLEHLESQFQEGMTWDNYGEWHVDHIKPCALFDFTKEEEQKECFHYTNLQPLWAEDNLRKSDKYIEEDLIAV